MKLLEYIRLAPKGSQRVSDFLEKAAEGLVDGGRWEDPNLYNIIPLEDLKNRSVFPKVKMLNLCVITGERYSRQCIFSWHGSQNERDERLMIIVGRVKLTDFFNLLFVCSVSSPFVAVFLNKETFVATCFG